MRALGKTAGRLQDRRRCRSFSPASALFVMAWMLAGLMGHLGNVTVRGGLITALFVWAGFVLTTTGVNQPFDGTKPSLTMIDGGHWLAVLLLMGAVIGAFGT